MKQPDPPHIPAQQPRSLSLFTFVLGCLLLFLTALVGLWHLLNRRQLPSTPADVGLVFGTGLHWKAQARVNMAAQLFHQGCVRYLIVSGGVLIPETTITEAAWFRDALVRRGVPDERILLEAQATNTAENATYALPIIQAQLFQSVVLIMSDFEGIRAHLTAKRAWHGQGLTIYDCHRPRRAIGIRGRGGSAVKDGASPAIPYRAWFAIACGAICGGRPKQSRGFSYAHRNIGNTLLW